MAHRLAFPLNANVPLAVKANESSGGCLTAFDPLRHDLLEPLVVCDEEGDASIDLLALDTTPLDELGPTQDLFRAHVTFTDSLGRKIELSANRALTGTDGEQYFGGVATNLFRPLMTPESPSLLWRFQPLVARASFDVRVNGALTDANLLGIVTLTEWSAGQTDEVDWPLLNLHLCPKRVAPDGTFYSSPVQAAEDLGMAGWSLTWQDVTFSQAPVLLVRVEKGDTVQKIAKDLAVDIDAFLRANDGPTTELEAGRLVRVPMFMRASDSVPKKVHPSVALTWHEIIRGWTTLN